MIFAAIVLPWAMLSKVDETGTARGRLEPHGKTLKLDAPVSGTVSAVYVKEGQPVKAGQVLVQLESELVGSELQQAQIDQTRQRLSASRNAYSLAQNRLERDRLEVQRYQSLLVEGVIPQIKVVEVERGMDESKRLLNQAKSDIDQAQTEIKKQQSDYENIVRTGELAVLQSERQIKQSQTEISGIETEIAQNKKQIDALKFQLQQRVLRSPIDGTIFQISIDNAGVVLQPGQAFSQIAPKGAYLIFRANVPSQDSGFLRVGMPVKLKFDAYPFQDYGVVTGH